MNGILDHVKPQQFPEELLARIEEIRGLLDYPALRAVIDRLLTEVREKPLASRFRISPLSEVDMDEKRASHSGIPTMAIIHMINEGRVLTEADIMPYELVGQIVEANQLVVSGIEKLVEVAIHLAASQSGE